MNEMTLGTRQGLGTYFREALATPENKPQIALASKDLAPLICRVVRAVRWRWALGLDSQWGTPAALPSSPPTSDIRCAARNIPTSNSENFSSFNLVLYVYRTLDV